MTRVCLHPVGFILSVILVRVLAQAGSTPCYWTSTVIYGDLGTWAGYPGIMQYTSTTPNVDWWTSGTVKTSSTSSTGDGVTSISSSSNTYATTTTMPSPTPTPFYIQAVVAGQRSKRDTEYVAFDDDVASLIDDEAAAAIFMLTQNGYLMSGGEYVGSSTLSGTMPIQVYANPPSDGYNWVIDDGTITFENATFCSTFDGHLYIVYGSEPAQGCSALSLVPQATDEEMSSNTTTSMISSSGEASMVSSTAPLSTTDASISSASAQSSLNSMLSSLSSTFSTTVTTSSQASPTTTSVSLFSPTTSVMVSNSVLSISASVSYTVQTSRTMTMSTPTSLSTTLGLSSSLTSSMSISTALSISTKGSVSTSIPSTTTTTTSSQLQSTPSSIGSTLSSTTSSIFTGSSGVFSSTTVLSISTQPNSTSSAMSSTTSSSMSPISTSLASSALSTLTSTSNTSSFISSTSTSTSTTSLISATSSSTTTTTTRTTTSTTVSSTTTATTSTTSSSATTSTTPSTTPSTTTTAKSSTLTTTFTTSSTTSTSTSTSTSTLTTTTSNPQLQAKRGLTYTNVNTTTLYPSPNLLAWSYNYFSLPNATNNVGPYPYGNPLVNGSNLRFIPLLYSDATSLTSIWSANVNYSIAHYGTDALFSFNEPDYCLGGKSACMSINRSITAYQSFIQPYAGLLKLGAPSITNTNTGLPYLQQFLGNATQLNLTVDFVNLHWYASPYNFQYFTDYVTNMSIVAGGRKIWISEYGMDNQNYADTAVQAFIKNTTTWLDAQSFVERYAWFGNFGGYLLNANQTGLSNQGVVWGNYSGGYVYSFN